LVDDSLWSADAISLDTLRGLRLAIESNAMIQTICLVFAGDGELDTWNSWLRAPRTPNLSGWSLLVDGQPRTFGAALTEIARTALPLRQNVLYPATVVSLLLEPPIHNPRELWLRFPSGPHLLGRIVLADEPLTIPAAPRLFPPPLPHYPLTQAQLAKQGDGLAQQLHARLGPAGEPTLESIAQLALPFRGGALLGHREGPLAYQLWDGGLLIREYGMEGCDRTHYRLSTEWLGSDLVRSEQRLHNGYLPIGEISLTATTGRSLSQQAFIDADDCLRARYTLHGLPLDLDPATVIVDELAQSGLRPSSNTKRARAQTLFRLETSPDDETLRLPTRTATRTIRRSGEHILVELSLPLADHSPRQSFDVARHAVESECNAYLAQGASLSIPEPTLDRLWKALLLHNRLFVRDGVMRYGLFPGVYDGGVFGVEEGWNIVAFAQYGHFADAESTLRQTFFDPAFLVKEGQHHQYRNGLALTYAADVFALGQNLPLLGGLWPQIAESAEWLVESFRSTQVLVDGERPIHYGLLPKHTYGGDLTEPAYSLYGSSTGWRGLRDAARLAAVVGDRRAAAWLTAAAEARRNLQSAAERSFRHDGKPPFLPFRTDERGDAPSANDYHQLFASLILETALFGWHGRWSHEITDYLEQTGRQTLQVARFDQWFGRLGVDAEYSRGTQLCALHRRDFSRFYLGLLGQVALSCDPQTFVSPETAIVLFGESEWRDRLRALVEQPSRFDSDPCSAGTAVMLQYLRLLFVCEERDEDDLPTGTLLIGAPLPPSFFASGQHFAADRLPMALGPSRPDPSSPFATTQGTISIRCESSAREVTYSLTSSQAVTVELFYFDAAGRHRSEKHRLPAMTMGRGEKPVTIRLPR